MTHYNDRPMSDEESLELDHAVDLQSKELRKWFMTKNPSSGLVSTVTPVVGCLVTDKYGRESRPEGVSYLFPGGFTGVHRPYKEKEFLTKLKLYMQCERVHRSSQSMHGYGGMSRKNTTVYETVPFSFELLKSVAEALSTQMHIVQCPVCNNIVSFEIVPKGQDDKRRPSRIFRKRNLNTTCVFLTQGEKCDGGERYGEAGMFDQYATFFHQFKGWIPWPMPSWMLKR
jgi:hypothetical protein